METTIEIWADKITDMITNDALLFKIALGVICAMSLFYLLRSWYNARKKDWESFYYIFICLLTLLWGGLALLFYLYPGNALVASLDPVRQAVYAYLPALMCLHIWRQVSYKEIRWPNVLGVFAVPFIITVLTAINFFAPGVVPQYYLPLINFEWQAALYYIYAAIMLVKCYLLCFNVFYQMPAHMRRSARYLLSGISAIAVASIAYFIFPLTIAFSIHIAAVGVMLVCFHDAFSVANSANVIVTSREFVFGSLSTMILVLSRKDRVLDWNKKDKGSAAPLPEPIYKEPFRHYRERMLREGNGKVSPHGDNIITTMHGDVERHYLITTHEIGRKKRMFGYIVEISEVSSIYSVLRYLEEIAIIDQLTGIYNRNAYLGMVASMTQPENMPLLVLVGDVNNLKRLNDTLGHLCGDHLLNAVSEIINQNMPAGTFAARIGGDEFVLLVPRGSEEIAQKFITDSDEACTHHTSTEYGIPSISWGYALMTSPAQAYNDVFAKADAMMYAAKKKHTQFRSSGFVPTQPVTAPAAPLAVEDSSRNPIRHQPFGRPPLKRPSHETDGVAAAFIKDSKDTAAAKPETPAAQEPAPVQDTPAEQPQPQPAALHPDAATQPTEPDTAPPVTTLVE